MLGRLPATAIAAGLFAAAVWALPGGASGNDAAPIVFGGSAAYPPHQWLNENGEPTGFLIDLQTAMGAAGQRPVDHRLMPWSRALAALKAGTVDAVPMFASPERARRYDFTDPFYYVTHAIFGPEDYPGVEGPGALNGRTVAVVEGGYAQSLLRDRQPKARLTPAADIESAVKSVASGETEFAVVAQPIAARLTAVLELPVKQISRPLWPRAYVFAVREGNTADLNWLQTNLRRVQAAGRYHEIYGDWRDELEWHPTSWGEVLARASWFIVPALLVAVLALGWNRSLRARVAGHTRALNAELARRRNVEASLIHAASHDPITDLPNRSEFKYMATAHLAEHRNSASETPVGVLTVSLADLAEVTSAFGYETGEGVVRSFAEKLSRLDENLVGDFGRGHFGLLRFGEWNGEELLAELSAPLVVDGLEIDPRLKASAAWQTDARESAEELIRRAETALASTESEAGGWTHYRPGMEPDPQDLLLVRDFRRDFPGTAQTLFQAQYEPASGRFVAAEALFRWAHPELGPISPGRLIPLLDKANLTPRVTGYVLESAIATAVSLRGAGHPLRVSINVSGSDFVADGLADRVGERLNALGGRPEDLCLEITETSLISDPRKVSRELEALSEMGVSCAIDDFGTGYSSLSYLGHFPLDEVKIDKSFVQRMTTEARHRAIVPSCTPASPSPGSWACVPLPKVPRTRPRWMPCWKPAATASRASSTPAR
ncbi:EAL domain-containing protein [Ectothiorhodospiraceae bacterium WFHF3C12]|nr:EAL domain-containing protein [Ectothiorhodospiraceae bacterium WFHF3C12]